MPFGCFCSRAVFCFQDLIPKESDSSLGQTGILKFTSYLIKRCLSPEPMEQKYDDQFRVVFDAIRQLMSSDVVEKESIGFRVEEEVVGYS